MVFKYSSNTWAKGTGESWSSFEFTFILGFTTSSSAFCNSNGEKTNWRTTNMSKIWTKLFITATRDRQVLRNRRHSIIFNLMLSSNWQRNYYFCTLWICMKGQNTVITNSSLRQTINKHNADNCFALSLTPQRCLLSPSFCCPLTIRSQ